MTVIKPVQYVGQLDEANIQNNHVLSDAKTVKTGVYHVVNGSTDKTCHLEIGGAPNAHTSTNPIHIAPLGTEYIMGPKPKNTKIVGATAADPCVLTLDDPHNQTNIVVGDYVTITGSSVSGYNFSHKEVTAVNIVTGAITIDADASSLAAFTGTAHASASIKISARGSGGNDNIIAYISEVALVGH